MDRGHSIASSDRGPYLPIRDVHRMSERRVCTRATTGDWRLTTVHRSQSVSIRLFVLSVRLAYHDKPVGSQDDARPGGSPVPCPMSHPPCPISHVPCERRDARCDGQRGDRGGDPRGPPSMTMMLVFTPSFTHARMSARQTVHNATHLVSCSEGSNADGHPASTQCSAPPGVGIRYRF